MALGFIFSKKVRQNLTTTQDLNNILQLSTSFDSVFSCTVADKLQIMRLRYRFCSPTHHQVEVSAIPWTTASHVRARVLEAPILNGGHPLRT